MKKVAEILKILKADGWFEVRQRGSHKQFKHLIKKGLVTVPFHSLSDEIETGTWKSIQKQAKIED